MLPTINIIGAGQIGTSFAKHAVKAGHRVRIFDSGINAQVPWGWLRSVSLQQMMKKPELSQFPAEPSQEQMLILGKGNTVGNWGKWMHNFDRRAAEKEGEATNARVFSHQEIKTLGLDLSEYQGVFACDTRDRVQDLAQLRVTQVCSL